MAMGRPSTASMVLSERPTPDAPCRLYDGLPGAFIDTMGSAYEA